MVFLFDHLFTTHLTYRAQLFYLIVFYYIEFFAALGELLWNIGSCIVK